MLDRTATRTLGVLAGRGAVAAAPADARRAAPPPDRR